MNVEIVGENTYLIQVALASRDPDEAAAIVNAVVEAYLDQHTELPPDRQPGPEEEPGDRAGQAGRRRSLRSEDELKELVDKGNVAVKRTAGLKTAREGG